ncbi:sorbin/SH3 domain protein [Rhynchospora pubera]|uniref:Sorbin/SH3 domain protein n=1 Tax=Rhynchospora pubera TaxID=906938 RepID=A0AAV8FBT4_9POAL|nr:sorbin/SH3 domain protein [Rhynchospora pubera]
MKIACEYVQDKSWVSVPEFGEWDKRRGVYMRDYSGHFAMMRSVRRYRKKLLSWTSIGNGDELVEQSSKPVKHPEHYRHVSDFDASGNSRRFNNRTRKSTAIGGFMRYFFCCFGH